MKNKYLNLNLGLYLSFFIISIYLVEFYLLDNSFNYFWCVEVNDNFNISGFNLKLPIHCDEGPYYEASHSLDYFFSEDNPYQKRPLYVLGIWITRQVIQLLDPLGLTSYQEFRLAILFVQFSVLFIILKLVIKYFDLKLRSFNDLLYLSIILLVPNIRWNIFFPSHGNLTLIALLITLVKINEKNRTIKSDKIFFLMLGFLSLAHRVFLIYGLLFIIYVLLNNKKESFGYIFRSISMLGISPMLYELSYFFTPYKSFDWNKEVYGQFFWIYNLLNNKSTLNNEESCQLFSTFFKCNLNISYEFTKFFLLIFIFLATILLILKFSNKKIPQDFRHLSFLSFGIYIFWSLQGFYPNFRFIQYSLGYFSILSLLLLLKNLREGRTFFLIAIFLYELSIYYLEPYSQTQFQLNNLTFFSILFFILGLFKHKQNFHKTKILYEEENELK